MTVGRRKLVAAVYLNYRGFAFVIFKDGLNLFNWGVVEVRGSEKREKILARIERLMPSDLRTLVLQMMSPVEVHRPERIRQLNDAIAELAKRSGFEVVFLARREMQARFSHLTRTTRRAIAAAIVKEVPAFARYLPKTNKAWKSEAARMAIFDAAALAFGFLNVQANG
ncbi:hypothetical protein [Bradyrhizobium guangdongense]|uniref:Uncharacterized protein n=1 Tax=Bradyrhizobium guangdongense TaxID=1325090 RepID=A0A410VEW2_9BRAD|nr:hypothetical protein [Bradyrhizobium guangdongense]QAU42205.1 hypothetical protein X265_34395 [Bradyrhizobium guangdongense]QOZ63264.1 hypothetical protein XH86_34435 [Bradyrhizobium guangdongense]GGI29838.1 hypothetical protein GCM10010987_56460 [Bradyrhizobium guangdongense]